VAHGSARKILMATATTLAAWDNALKQYYRAAEVAKVVYDSHPFMELVPKDRHLSF
jgi:hypothetical protein